MSDMYALLMAGILGTLLGFFILITNVWTVDCKVNVSLTGRTVSISLPPAQYPALTRMPRCAP